MARGALQIQDAKKSPSRHHRTTLSGHIFATKACISTIGKKFVKQQSTRPDNMVNFGRLTAEIGSGVCGTPTNFNGFCVLAALLHGSYWRQPNFAALNRGRHLCSAGQPSGWALAHILVSSCFFLSASSSFFSSPNLSGRRLDVYHTSTHGVALVRI